MTYQRLCTLGEVPPGTARQLALAGIPVAVCNVGGEPHALHGRCPHRGGPLGDGTLEGSQLTCPWHAWTFDVITGTCLTTPDVKLVEYALRVDGHTVLVELG